MIERSRGLHAVGMEASMSSPLDLIRLPLLLGLAMLLAAADCGASDDEPECPDGTSRCGDICVAISKDPSHCGGCDVLCDEGEVCSEGACVKGCPEGLAACGTSCVDFSRDADHCGDCGVRCDEEQICQSGSCVDACAGELRLCEGECVDFATDDENCGGCGVVCPDRASCESGSCQCESGLRDCGGICADTEIDPLHCGACGQSCEEGELCESGSCVPNCSTGLLGCEGSCIDPMESDAHCGACGQACENGQVCVDGSCACPMGTEDCDGTCAEVENDDLHCGTCGNACQDGKTCSEGSCRCPEGMEECDGVCVDTDVTTEHCGQCGRNCTAEPNALPSSTCVDGTCVYACADGFDDCNLAEGCETPVTADVKNCGACGITCLPGEVCTDGACVCPAGSLVCGTACIDVSDDFANCGACGNVCRLDQLCDDAQCVCSEGLEACEGKCAHLATDVEHCGSCGNSCREDQICEDSSCACPEPLEECQGACLDTRADDENCGACGNTCDEDRRCVNGSCVCNWPLNECNGECISLQSDPENCGSCGTVCREDQICNWGCVCPEGTINCEGACVPPSECASGPCGDCPSGCEPSGECIPAVAVDGGVGHTCAMNKAHEIWCWGDNRHGQLGDGNPGAANRRSVQVLLPDRAMEFSVGNDHACAVLADTTVACWGRGDRGQLGNGDTADQSRPVIVKELRGIEQIAAGGDHTCARDRDGMIWCWGANDDGRLGHGSPGRDESVPALASEGSKGDPLKGTYYVGASNSNTCAVMEDMRVRCWGTGTEGQNGDDQGKSTDGDPPVEVLFHGGPLEDIWLLWGGTGTLADRFCAMSKGGDVFCWGRGDSGALGNQDTENALSAVENYARHHDGLYAIVTGDAHGCAVTHGSQVLCWGERKEGRVGTGEEEDIAFEAEPVRWGEKCEEELYEIESIGGGANHTCAVDYEGRIYCWGRNDTFQVSGNHPEYVLCATSLSSAKR